MNKEPVLLECYQLCKSYKDADNYINVLMGVCLSVKKGEQVAIMGRSGSGKTTLLQLLSGLDSPTSGEVRLNGQALQRFTAVEQERIRNRSLGFVYQSHHLLSEFSAIENVAMPLLIGGISPKQAEKKAMELLDAVGLSNRVSHRPAELSGGERQRVAIARALVNDPECVLADEPTGNLDDETAAHVFEILKNVNRIHQTTLLIVTHDMDLAYQMDRAFILQGGVLSEAFAHDPIPS